MAVFKGLSDARPGRRRGEHGGLSCIDTTSSIRAGSTVLSRTMHFEPEVFGALKPWASWPFLVLVREELYCVPVEHSEDRSVSVIRGAAISVDELSQPNVHIGQLKKSAQM